MDCRLLSSAAIDCCGCAGAKADVRDTLGSTPLHRAASALRIAVVRALLDAAPACIDAADAEGNTALHICVSQGEDPRSIEIARLLVQRGADLLTKNKAGEGPMAIFGDKVPAKLQSASNNHDEAMVH